MRVTAVIPARYAATRFPGKPLAMLAGKPMIEHVYRRAQAARLIEYVIVATDDERIRAAVEAFGGHAMMTNPGHPTGTDRIAEVARQLDCEIVVNVQGDEPLISPTTLDAVVKPLLADPSLPMSTAMAPLTEEERDDPAAVKVVVDQQGFALYFSRSLIPYPRVAEAAQHHKHLGLYAYRREFLLQFASWPPTMLERAESLEQLRVLEHGQRIKVVPVAQSSIGVDTPADLERAERLLQAL